jgi:pimeloyl-ACP methyl ester carboxylesterase
MFILKSPGKLVMIGALFVLLAGLGGTAYNEVSIRHYRKIAGLPGRIYEINHHSMHLYCTGEGSPTIVLSSGLGDDFLGWVKVQPVLSKQTSVCSYDRAGFGWSDLQSGPQDADSISDQLHQLVGAAAVQRPFVLVGHSISGLYLRSYASHYPSDLVGMVFVDGATPLQDDRIPKEILKIQEDQRRRMPLRKLLTTVGWYRLQGGCTSVPPDAKDYSAWIKADSCIPSQLDAMENELDAERKSGEETIQAGPFGDLPVLILSHDPDVLPPNWPPAAAKDMSVVWNTMQEEAKGLSSKSRRIIAKGSDHYIQNDRPDVVNQQLSLFVTMIRNHQTFSGNGSTTSSEGQ